MPDIVATVGNRETADVCVVVVNFNAGDHIVRCVDALHRQLLKAKRIVVVDNASSDGSCELLMQRFPELEILRLGENTGFAKANNRAFADATDTAWVALLNPDAFPEPDWLLRLWSAVTASPEYSFFGCRLVDAVQPELLDGDGDVYHVSGAAWRRNHGQPLSCFADSGGLLFSPCAAAALYRREALIEAGGFDERFFCYFEDVDLGFRLRLLGHQGKQIDDAVVKHVGSAITGRLSDFTLYHIQRNLVWTYVKNMPAGLFWLYLPQHLLLNLAGLVALWRRGKGQVVLRAKWDALKGLPRVLAQRREIQRRRVVGSRKLLDAMMRGIAAPYRRDKPTRP